MCRDTIRVLAGHLHHYAQVRPKQWEQLGQKLIGTDVPLITLCDHNSHVLLGADSEGLRESKLKIQLADQTRQQEVTVIEKWGLHDAWDVVYGESDGRPSGFTYAWSQNPGTRWKPRRLDSVHVASSLREYVWGAYTTTAVA